MIFLIFKNFDTILSISENSDTSTEPTYFPENMKVCIWSD